jgi:hypothetical protein
VGPSSGLGLAQLAFALSLRARGLTSQGRTSLPAALSQLEADRVDSDGDGTPDIDELRAGTDPNSSANASLIGDPDPGYGCGGSPPRGGGGRGAAAPLFGASGFGWLFRQLRRGRK